MIKAVIFDWGGVLIDLPNAQMYKYFASVLKVDIEQLKHIICSLEDEWQRGKISEDDLWVKVCGELRVALPDVKSLWYDAFSHSYKSHEDVFSLAKGLKTLGYKIGLLSNAEERAMRFFYDQKYDFFDSSVFSCAIGFRKPEAAIYRESLSRLGVLPSEAVFVDDVDLYVEGARKLGMHAIKFSDFGQLKRELELLLDKK